MVQCSTIIVQCSTIMVQPNLSYAKRSGKWTRQPDLVVRASVGGVGSLWRGKESVRSVSCDGLSRSSSRYSGGAPKCTLRLLDKVQSKAIRLINNPNLTKSLQPLSHRRLVGDLSIFYRYFNGHCSQEIRDIIPVPLRRFRTTRSSTHSHPFQVSLPNPRTLSHKSSFIPRTCNLWNVLPSSCFPESCNLPSFKSKMNKLDLNSLSS